MIPLVDTVRKLIEKINIKGRLATDEPMAGHTTFKTGGAADLYAVPADEDDLRRIIEVVRGEGAPLFVIGGGANILVSDLGIRGLVLDMGRFTGRILSGTTLTAEAGCTMSGAAEYAEAAGFSGPDTFYAMPGTLGGSVWMNARCYGRSLSDLIEWVEYIDTDGRVERLSRDEGGFDYKVSPFQKMEAVIIRASLSLEREDPQIVRERMEGYKRDRESKGHFLAPCAGSVYKNNRDFGRPTGQIIDSLGMKGLRMGGAQVSPLHGNIIINAGSATSREIRGLMELIEKRVFEATGFRLEREVLLVGDWDSLPFPG
jgi:UDP-N-acetylmuramate dehydrogenase